jgi:ribA/ribD-fused uncharacterized protein
MTTYLQFHSKSAQNILPLKRLSNFSEDPVTYNGVTYPTVEHAFQAQKYSFTDKPELMQLFTTYATAAEAKSAGTKGAMKKHKTELDINKWNECRDAIMVALITSKIEKNPDIKNILVIAKQNNIRFVHFSRTDMYWGAHMNEDGSIKKGENRLGIIYNKYIDSIE